MKGENAAPAADRGRGWYVSRETARGFLAGERRCARYLGLAFFFWALAGVPWVMLPPGGGQRPLGMGLCVLLGICAAVAAMFSQREDYAVLRREPLLLDQAVLKELRDEYRALRGRYLLVAAPSVVLFVSGLLALAAASRGMVPWTGYHALAFLVLAAGLWGSVWSPERHGQLRAAGGKPAALCRCVVQAPAAAPGEAGVPVICSEYGEQCAPAEEFRRGALYCEMTAVPHFEKGSQDGSSCKRMMLTS